MTVMRLSVSGLRASLGGREVLRGVDLVAGAGELTAVLGPSGCGKTTLLRAIAGFVTPDSGEIRIEDDVVASAGHQVPAERRGVCLVPQEGALFPHLDVAGNVGFGLSRAERRGDRVREVLDLVGLADRATARPRELSGGQQQRVALARALAPRPRLVLLDEPFTALDAALRASLRAQVRQALIADGATALLVTHDQDEALSLADTVAVMAGGRILMHDTPADVYHRPTDLEVARFVGHLVEVPAELDGDTALTPLGRVPVAPTDGGQGRFAGAVAFRPEQLLLLEPDAAHGVAGRIEHRDFYGHDAVVAVRLAGGTPVTVRLLGQDLPAGEQVRVTVRGSGLVLGTGPAGDARE